MLRFAPANTHWWQKPLVLVDGRALTAELAVLGLQLRPGEQGVWLNSRGRTSGVVDLVPRRQPDGPSFATRRTPLPPFVAAALNRLYGAAGVKKGCPDLVIWRSDPESLRLVEVKCPHWDSPTPEQERFLEAAAAAGISASVIEWEFSDGAA